VLVGISSTVARMRTTSLLAFACLTACSGTLSGLGFTIEGAPANQPTQPDGPQPKAPLVCKDTPPRVWSLTAQQYGNTLKSLCPTADVPSVVTLSKTVTRLGGAFSNQSAAQPLTEPYVQELHDVARAWAVALSKTPQKIDACAAKGIDSACANTLFSTLLTRAYRHPAEQDSVKSMVDFFEAQKASEGASTALELALVAIAMSPDMLFRTELGDGARLTPFELASAVSYTLTDGPPDQTLLDAAQRNALGQPSELEAQARRLVKDKTLAAGIRRFLSEHFELKKVTDVAKDVQLFPEFTPALATELAESTRRSVEDAVWSNGGKLSALLTTDKATVSAQTAPYYGVPAPNAAGWQTVTMPSDRRGLLTYPGILLAHSQPARTSIVFRGKFILERMLCSTLLPPAQVPPLPLADPNLPTQRQRLTALTKPSGCMACHASMNAMGFPFETFDALGRARSLDDGAPIDTSGQLMIEPPVAVNDAVDFSQKLSASRVAEQCLASQFVESVFGAAKAEDVDPCTQQRLVDFIAKSDGDVLETFVHAVTDDSFSKRSAK
jgi:hypothetical protein